MNDFTALNEAYDAMASSRMTTRQVIGNLTIDAHGHIFLNRPKGTISIPAKGHILNLRSGRSLIFRVEEDFLSVSFEDSSGDMINGEYLNFPTKGVLHFTLSLMDDVDGPILDVR